MSEMNNYNEVASKMEALKAKQAELEKQMSQCKDELKEAEKYKYIGSYYKINDWPDTCKANAYLYVTNVEYDYFDVVHWDGTHKDLHIILTGILVNLNDYTIKANAGGWNSYLCEMKDKFDNWVENGGIELSTKEEFISAYNKVANSYEDNAELEYIKYEND